MIAETDQRLLDWCASVLDGARASLAPPSDESGEDAVSVYLLDFAHESLPRGQDKPPLQLGLRYLITARGRDEKQVHDRLWQLLLDATVRGESKQWAVEREPPPLELWRALGVAPRPSFVLRVAARHEWARPPAGPPVKQRIIAGGPVRTLKGVVLGPGSTPIAGAMVDLPSLGQSVETDRAGRFAFAAVPGGEYRPRKLVVRARGRRQDVDVPADAGSEPFVIQFNLSEV